MIIPRRGGRTRSPIIMVVAYHIYGCKRGTADKGKERPAWRGGGASCINYPNEDWAQPTYTRLRILYLMSQQLFGRAAFLMPDARTRNLSKGFPRHKV